MENVNYWTLQVCPTLALGTYYLAGSWHVPYVTKTSCAGGRHNMPRPLWPWPFDLESGVRATCDAGYLGHNFSLLGPVCSQLKPDVRDKRRQTSDSIIWPRLEGGDIITFSYYYAAFPSSDLLVSVSNGHLRCPSEVKSRQSSLAEQVIYTHDRITGQYTDLIWYTPDGGVLCCWECSLEIWCPSGHGSAQTH